MTDGTSQGLFIVVAIVIFGIFTVLAYILFEDTLSPALASMFTTATEQASKSLQGIEVPFQVKKTNTLNLQTLPNHTYIFETEGDYVNGEGVYIPNSEFKPHKKYTATYEFTVLEGEVHKLGGRVEISDDTDMYVNGDFIGKNYNGGHFYDFEVGETYLVQVDFNTNKLNKTLAPHIAHFYIQTNRHFEDVNNRNYPHKVKISNLTLFEHR